MVSAAFADGGADLTTSGKESQPKDFMQKLKDAGVTPQLIYTGEEFGNFTGGTSQGGNYEGLLKLTLGLDLEKLVGWSGGSSYFAVLYPHGPGITNRYVHDYNVLSSIDAYDSWRLFEAWVQQDFSDHRYSIRIGQLTTDNNFFVSDGANLYINSVFGVTGTALHNVIVPIYPVASPGIHFKWQPNSQWYFQTMAVSDNPGAQDGNNKHGLRYDLHTGALIVSEAGYQRSSSDTAAVLEGKYKVGGLYDTGWFPDNSTGIPRHGTSAVYVIVDQQVYRQSFDPKEAFRGASAFFRGSLAPEDRNPVTRYFDAGLNYTGLLHGREKDILGVAFSYERLSSELRQASGEPVPSHHEHVLEASYLWTCNDHFSVQPDLQYIWNPGAIGTTPNAFVGGVRFAVTF
jgi:porin